MHNTSSGGGAGGRAGNRKQGAARGGRGRWKMTATGDAIRLGGLETKNRRAATRARARRGRRRKLIGENLCSRRL